MDDVEVTLPADERLPIDETAVHDDPAADVLAGARSISAGRYRERDRARARRVRRENLARRAGDPTRNSGGFSGPGPDPDRDPQLIGSLLGSYVADQGWEAPLAQARVFAEWPALVGAGVADHCTPETLTDGELRVSAESTAWATQLRMLSSSILARLVAELGPDIVVKVIFTGPSAPSWRHGAWSVRGARGPRDTYG